MTYVGRRILVGIAALVVCSLALVACQPGTSKGTATPTVAATASTLPSGPFPTDAVLPPTDPIEGVVTHVDSTGLDSVTGFTLRAVDGKTYDFIVGRLQNASQFPPGHLVEHAANSEPILVTFQALGSQIFALRLDDAGPAATTPAPAATGSPGPS